MKISNDNLPKDIAEAMEYLKTGGLGEVYGFADMAFKNGSLKIQCDTDMAIALCILANQSLKEQTRD